MSTVHSVKEVKESVPSVKLAVIAMLLLPLVGVGCLLFPRMAEKVLPYFLGVRCSSSSLTGMVRGI